MASEKQMICGFHIITKARGRIPNPFPSQHIILGQDCPLFNQPNENFDLVRKFGFLDSRVRFPIVITG